MQNTGFGIKLCAFIQLFVINIANEYDLELFVVLFIEIILNWKVLSKHKTLYTGKVSAPFNKPVTHAFRTWSFFYFLRKFLIHKHQLQNDVFTFSIL